MIENRTRRWRHAPARWASRSSKAIAGTIHRPGRRRSIPSATRSMTSKAFTGFVTASRRAADGRFAEYDGGTPRSIRRHPPSSFAKLPRSRYDLPLRAEDGGQLRDGADLTSAATPRKAATTTQKSWDLALESHHRGRQRRSSNIWRGVRRTISLCPARRRWSTNELRYINPVSEEIGRP